MEKEKRMKGKMIDEKGWTEGAKRMDGLYASL